MHNSSTTFKLYIDLEWLYQNQEEQNDVYRQKYDELELEFKNILSRQLLTSNLNNESFISI